jgi:hypothetical protein
MFTFRSCHFSFLEAKTAALTVSRLFVLRHTVIYAQSTHQSDFLLLGL